MSDLNFAKDIAHQCGEFIRQARANKNFSISLKDDRSFVTEADVAVDRMIRDAILKHSPSDKILSEELAPNFDDARLFEGRLWVVDPIDGTTNFARGHLHVAVAIGLSVDGKMQCGVVHAPFVDETFWAERGQGAFLNGTRIEPSQRAISEAIVLTGFPASARGRVGATLSRLNKVLTKVHDIRRLGSAALDICSVACGRTEGFFEDGIKPWDLAAAGIVAREAGCKITNLTPQVAGEPIPAELYSAEILVATPRVFDTLRDILLS